MITRITYKWLLGLAVFACVFQPLSVSAAVNLNDAGSLLNRVSDPEKTGLSQDNLQTSTGTLIQRALTLVGIIFLVLMIYAGILWMTARGNNEQISSARNTIIAAIIGLVVVVGSYAITSLILQRLAAGAQGTVNSNGTGYENAQGCCLDRVNAGWACRVTTEQDCVQRGIQCETGDEFCKASDYKFIIHETNVQSCLQQCDYIN